jgi:hypothetical protein
MSAAGTLTFPLLGPAIAAPTWFISCMEPGITGLVEGMTLAASFILGGWFTPEKLPGLGSCCAPWVFKIFSFFS